jgi:DNA polymerase III alpha subunit (gram-positive type)
MLLTDESGLRFAVVDVETTGLSLRWNRLLQVGVVTVDHTGTVTDRWSSLVRPKRRLFRVGPTSLHGIGRAELRRAPSQVAVLTQLAARLDGAVFVAHNAAFDLGFLRKAAAECGVALPIRSSLCTLGLSRRLDPDRARSHRLGALCERYDVTLVKPHDALADADATAAVLPHLFSAHGIDSVEGVQAQLDAA